MKKMVERLVQIVAVSALTGLVVSWFRSRADPLEHLPPLGEASWPPLESDVPTDVPRADATQGEPGSPENASWIAPNGDGTCPLTHPVKGKASSGIYHVPEGLSYERTKADRCYSSPEAAETDGYRASKM